MAVDTNATYEAAAVRDAGLLLKRLKSVTFFILNRRKRRGEEVEGLRAMPSALFHIKNDS